MAAKAFRTSRNIFLTHLSGKNSYAMCVAEPMKAIGDDSPKISWAQELRRQYSLLGKASLMIIPHVYL